MPPGKQNQRAETLRRGRPEVRPTNVLYPSCRPYLIYERRCASRERGEGSEVNGRIRGFRGEKMRDDVVNDHGVVEGA